MSGSAETSPLRRSTTVDSTTPESHGLPPTCNIETDDALDRVGTLSRSLSGELVKRAITKSSRSITRSCYVSAEEHLSPNADHERALEFTRHNKDDIKTDGPLNICETRPAY
jgi:hypothetical protein